MIEALALYGPCLALMLLDPVHDYILIETGTEINHFRHTAWAALGYVIILATWGAFVNPPVAHYFAHALFISALRWNVHDLALNALRGKAATYQGDGVNDALTDKILKAIPINPILTKVLVLWLCGGIAIYILSA